MKITYDPEVDTLRVIFNNTPLEKVTRISRV
jgi:hypothetical protein